MNPCWEGTPIGTMMLTTASSPRDARARLACMLPLALLIWSAFTGSVAAGNAPSVTRFSPTGTVKQVRQVTAQFSTAMVPLGDPRAAVSPFDIDCPEKGAPRWIDSFNWSYDFAHDLPAGVRCTFRLRAGLKTLGGAALTGQTSFTFDTGGPAIIDNRPWTGDSEIDERQAFVLALDADADDASIAAHASFSVEGLTERVGATLMAGADRAVLLKRFEQMTAKRPVVILQARQSFPNGAAVHLIWGKGIKTKSGIATSQDQVLNFKVRKAFVAKVRCERENVKAGCIPLTPISVDFTAPIARDAALKIALLAPDGARLAPKVGDDMTVRAVEFPGPFQESAAYKVELPPNLTDQSSRKLINASRFPYEVTTDVFPPLAKFSARFGIIESADPVLPVTVRNLEAELHGAELKLPPSQPTVGGLRGLLARVRARLWRIDRPDAKTTLAWLNRVAEAKRTASIFGSATAGQKEFTLPEPDGPAAFQVMGIPLKHSGLYIVELKSEHLGSVLLGRPAPMYVPTAALVTNLAVHFKKGQANSLVWVTELGSAKPVNGADVTIADCNGDRIWSGRTDRRGIAMVPQLDALDNPPRCDSVMGPVPNVDYYSNQVAALRELKSGVLVTARHGQDFAFVHSSWHNGIEPWRFRLPTSYQPSALVAHTVFDRTLFRAGETAHMKHFIRTRTLDGFGLPRADELPDTLRISFTGGDQHYDFALAWNPDGTAETTWKIPRNAKLGQYSVTMSRRKLATPTPSPSQQYYMPAPELTSGRFRVEEFRVPLMKAAVKMPAGNLVGVTRLPVDVSAEYLSGGAAKALPVVLRSQITRAIVPSFTDFEQFTFANGPVKEGVFKSEIFESAPPEETARVHQRRDLVLDAAGGARTEITEVPRENVPQQVRAEIEFRDPNGEGQTVSNTATVWPARWLVGLRADDWVSSPGAARAQIAVVDDSGKPVAHAPVNVVLLTRKFYSYRKRLVGGFYAYENTEEVKGVGPLCSGTTDARGLMFCDEKPGITGEAILQASVTDPAGNVCTANISVYIPGKSRMWFQARDEDRIDVIPEKHEYQPGDVARFQVRMPFPEATALVTVEREGIIAASIVHLSGRNPIVTLPVRDYAPNVFVSVLAVRGRIAAIQPTAMVDLGKPAFKLGIAEIRVGWREHRLKVTVAPERSVYRVREKARVKISVRMPDGSAPPAGSNVAVAAVDEGLLELKPNQSWKLLQAMMNERPYQVQTSTAEMQVVGRRHFGLKALPPGGGGGKAVTRELFNTLLLWKAVVALDSSGDAIVVVPLNDSLTSFRIVAIAAVRSGDFGTGAASIRSTQDLMLFSGVSPTARTGDTFAAEFTVRNASEKPFAVTVDAAITGLASKLTAQKVTLGAGEGKTVAWNVEVPTGVDALTYRVDAVAASGSQDHLLISQKIVPAVPIRTWQATLLQLRKSAVQAVRRPADSLPGRGGVEVVLSPSLSAGLGAVREWMRAYPYICMEQRVSRAVALGDPALWKSVVSDLPSYTDSDGLLKYFPDLHQGSDVLTSYVLSIASEAELAIPAPALAAMETGLRKFIEGKLSRPEPFAVADLPLRKLAAIEALSHYGKAAPELLGSIAIDPNLWPDSAVIDWASILARAPALPDRARRLDEAERILRARLNRQGTAMQLASSERDEMWWLMVSPARNMVRLEVMLLDANLWHDDSPLIMRGALAMQQRGSWHSTITNAWGTLAVDKFARAFEATPIGGTTALTLAGATQKLDWTRDPRGGSLQFAWPPALASLNVTHSGAGNPWAQIRTSAAIPLRAPFSSGYTITKKLTPVESTHRGEWKQGDLVRVHLKIEAQTDMTWVVVDDPIPAGASQLGTGLGHDSQIATANENANNQNFVWPAFVERGFEGFRAYYDYVPKGSFEIEYTIRLNQAGTFQMPPTHVEALYEPEMLGELPNAPFTVGH
jgi:uncharacterized protein YfaS (alpha-2-macroglobulin family)